MRSQLGAIIMSAIIIVAFAVLLGFVVTRGVPEGSQDLSKILLGTMATMAGQVTAYWLGSSASSARKDIVIADGQAALATSVPASALPSINQPAGDQ